MLSKKKYYSFLFLILIISFLVRFINFSQAPPALYWEELALGYDAYSIKETLHDHHGNFLPIIAFESFGDYKPSFYFYLVAFNLLFLPLDVLAVRLPSIIAGVLIVLGFNLFWRIFDRRKYHWHSLLIMLIAGFNPWLIHFSRSGWESNVATFLIFYGVIFFVFSLFNLDKKLNKYSLIISQIFFGLSFYTYHAARFVAPLLICFLYVVYLIKQLSLQKKSKQIFFSLLIPVLINIVTFLPLLVNFNNRSVNNRFAETSIFSNLEVIETSNSYKDFHDNNFLAKIFYHRYYLFTKIILSNFFQHFNFEFLFLNGDSNLRHSLRSVGLFYFFDSLIFFLGLIYLLKKRNKFKQKWWLFYLLLFWIFIGIFPASISKTVPHALRILNTSVVFIILLNFGYIFLFNLINLFKNIFLKKFTIFLVLMICFSQIFYYNFYYHKIYPKTSQSEWQYGYSQTFNNLSQAAKQYNQVYIVRDYGRPAMAYFFYNKINPRIVQKLSSQVKKDQSEFLEFLNIKFINSLNEVDFDKDNILVVVSDRTNLDLLENIHNEKKQIINQTFNLTNDLVWQTWKIN